MADDYPRPTLPELVRRISADLRTYTGRDSYARNTILWVLARAVAGAVWLLWGFPAWIYRQILPDRSSEAVLYRQGAVYRLDRLQPTQAAIVVVFEAEADSEIPDGTTIQSDGGVEYVTVGLASESGGEIEVQALAAEYGAAPTVDVGAAMALASPIAGVTSEGAVTESTPGTDAEAVEAYRARLLARIGDPPQGGSLADYRLWCAEWGAARAWPVANGLGLGTVLIRFAVSGSGSDQIPTGPEVAALQAYITERAPVTAAITVQAPDPLDVDLTIQIVPDTADVRAAVSAELTAMFDREAVPGGTIANSLIREAISRADGESYHTLIAVNGGAGTDGVTAAAGELAILGTITWA